MNSPSMLAQILMTFGGLFLVGLLADLLGRHTPLPRVTLLILTGFAIGPSGLNWLPTFIQDWFPLLTDVALAMVGFLLGQGLTRGKLSEMARPILGISIAVMIMTASLIFVGMLLLGAPLELALILAGIAPATAPAPVVDVIKELDAKGNFTDTLMGIVAVDDAWGLLLFSILLVLAAIVTGNGHADVGWAEGAWEVLGSILLGCALGLPMAYLTSHIYPGKSSQAEVLGLVLLCAGLAEWLKVSYILSAMVMGMMVANFAKHHRHLIFEELEAYEWPVLILFLLLAGASLSFNGWDNVVWLLLGYILLRVLGRISGSYLGAKWAGCESTYYRQMGLAMLPHAGVPIGMALLAAQNFPNIKGPLLSVILSATIIFELVGPALTRRMLMQAGQVRKKSSE